MKYGYVLGVDIGATWTRVALVGKDGVVACYVRERTPFQDYHSVLDWVRDAAQKAGDCVEAIIFGVPGPVEYVRQRIVGLPNLPQWDVAALSRTLRDFAGPPVWQANDTDLAVLGEQRFGSGKGVDNVVFLSYGSGIGAGVLLNGKLAVGRYSLGEIGHTIIDMATLQTMEHLVSVNILQNSLLPDSPVETDTAVVAADPQDVTYITVSTALSLCVRLVALCFMPDLIVLGGGVFLAHPELLLKARSDLTQIEMITPLKPHDLVLSCLGEDASMLGAYVYWESLLKEVK